MDIENVDQVMYEAAICPGVRVETADVHKPWHSEELQDLLEQRRVCRNARERTKLQRVSKN